MVTQTPSSAIPHPRSRHRLHVQLYSLVRIVDELGCGSVVRRETRAPNRNEMLYACTEANVFVSGLPTREFPISRRYASEVRRFTENLGSLGHKAV